MKKMILTVVAMMTFTLSFAETNVHHPSRNAARYEITVDMRRLASKLDLDAYQMEAVEAIHNCFNNDMLSAATARRFERRELVHEAVRKDASQMHRILNDKQFKTYMTLLVTTLRNRGL